MRTTGGTADLELDVQAAPWVDLRSLALYENGRPVALVSDGRGASPPAPRRRAAGGVRARGRRAGRSGATRLRATVRVRPAADAHYVAVVRGIACAGGGGRRAGYANPTYVDVNGDGWRAPAAP